MTLVMDRPTVATQPTPRLSSQSALGNTTVVARPNQDTVRRPADQPRVDIRPQTFG